MKTPHTPGPYRWEQRGLLGQNDKLVLRIDSGVIPMNPDAKLLAAAPELLAALRAMLSADEAICENKGTKSDQAMNRIAAIDAARAAIAKAGGGR